MSTVGQRTAGGGGFEGAVDRIGTRSARLGLGVRGGGASVWPVLGSALMIVALVGDRLQKYPHVPLRWAITLIIGGLVVSAGELRRGGRVPLLRPVPQWLAAPAFRTVLLLLLVAQLTAFLSVGWVQIAWWTATAAVAVPVLQSHNRVESLQLGRLTLEPQAIGSLSIIAALVVSLAPGQWGPGTLWSVLAGVAAAATLADTVVALPFRKAILPTSAALMVGIAVTVAGLSVVGLLWIVGGWLIAVHQWQLFVGPHESPSQRFSWRSGPAVAVAGALVALVALFGRFETTSSSGYWIPGWQYQPYADQSYNGGYVINLTQGYAPGYSFDTSGRDLPVAPLVVADLVCLLVVARRGGAATRLVQGAVVAGAGAVLAWILLQGSVGYVAVWTSTIGVGVVLGWSLLGFFGRRRTVSASTDTAGGSA